MTSVHSRYNCPTCGSIDNLTLYEDGGWHCFTPNCKGIKHPKYFLDNEPSIVLINTPVESIIHIEKDIMQDFITGEYKELPARGISLDTCKFFNYQLGEYRGKRVHIENYLNPAKELVGQRYRTKDKNFISRGDSTPLFGMHKWNNGKNIIITEGAIDAMSYAQVTDYKYPVVSLSTGAQGAAKQLKQHYNWLMDNFDTITLMFDNDKAGQEGVSKCATLFPYERIKVVSLPLKDANECLLSGDQTYIDKLKFAALNAKPYKPKDFYTISELFDECMEYEPTYGQDYPFPSLNKYVYGMCPNQLNLWTADSGCGKTTVFKQIVKDLLVEKKKVCIFFLEETKHLSCLTLAGLLANRRLDSPEFPTTKGEKKRAMQDMLDNYEDYLYIHGADFNNDWEAIKQKIRFAVKVWGAEYIMFDHLTILFDGQDGVVQLAEKIMRELAELRLELNVHIEAIAHLRKMSGNSDNRSICMDDMKGAGALKQYANNIFSIEKVYQDKEEVPEIRRITILKSREAGHNTGKEVFVRFNPETNMMEETTYNPDMGEDDSFEDDAEDMPLNSFF